MNMFIKVVVLLAVCWLFETSESTVIHGIRKATLERLERAINKTIEAKRQSAVEVDAIRNLVERKIEIALQPIEKDIKNLKCKVKRAEREAKANGDDISECVSQERKEIHEVNKEIVRVCAETKETIAASQKLSDLGVLTRALRQAPYTCANKGFLADTCVNTIIDSSNQRILVLQDEISVILRHTRPDERNECITESIQQLQDQVDKVSDDWLECLQRHENPTPKES